MFDDLPEDIERALRVVYNFADDGTVSEMTRKGAEDYGYDIDGQSCHYLRIVISKNRTWEDVV